MFQIIVCFLIIAPVPKDAFQEEKIIREVVAAFLKGLKDKDLEAVIKTMDVPFAFNTGFPDMETINESDELREVMAKVMKKADAEQVKSFKVGMVYDKASFSKYANECFGKAAAKQWIIQAEKLVGKNGFMEKDETGRGILIRIKDGKAFVVGVSQMLQR